ncbi:MAG TPA: alanine--glyoxylate aminotransferase family protein, partial [Dehalococcoidia bacterium]|nr:alanine--glyoxylate aminotransferase family protein [Dehalococcoidia bacterium]
MLQQQLRVPGPTPLPERVVRSASRPMVNHRGPEFAAVLDDVVSGLQWALRTRNDVLLFPASGTGGLEAAVVNTLSPGEQALFCTMGSFGNRWAAIAQAYGADLVTLEVQQGEPIDPEDVDRILAEHPGITTVFVTHNETSTGVTNDMPALAAVVKSRGKLLCVDSVSGAGCLPLSTDELGIDVCVTGSQKGWMAPPGVAMVSVSAAALERGARATMPRFYLDFAREKKYQDKHQTFTTPPLSVIYALQEGLAMMREEGLEQVWARHA